MHKLSSAVLFAFLLLGCSRSEKPAPHYMVSIEPQRWALAQLADSGMVIDVMLAGGADPEMFEPSMRQRRNADHAAIYFSTGVLPFEERLLGGMSDASRMVSTFSGVEPVYGTHDHNQHDHGHGHEQPDPHYWTSVAGMRATAANMARALIAHGSDSAAVSRRLTALDSRLDSLDKAISARLADGADSVFAVTHPSLSYYARDYGLHQLAIASEGKDMSARSVRSAIEAARKERVGVFFESPYGAHKTAADLAAQVGARLVVVDLLDPQWDKQMMLIADELAR